MAIVTTTDFVNKFELTLTDFNTAKLTAYIDRYETITLIELTLPVEPIFSLLILIFFNFSHAIFCFPYVVG